MANILWKQLDKEKQDKYINRISILGILSGLFKDLDGENGKKPYLHYRNHEISFINSFEVQGITRKDSAFDAIARVNGRTIGVGLKTWIHSSDDSNQKVAEFNKKSAELRRLFDLDKNIELAIRVSELRNNRIDDDKRLYETDLDVYHFITRDNNCFYIIESEYEKIEIDNIHDVSKSASSISFSDGKNNYLFNVSKSTLFKKFNASEKERIKSVKIDIHEDPFAILESIFNDIDAKQQNQIVSFYLDNAPKSNDDFIMLPLYNDDNYLVNKKSAFNASLGSSKSKGSGKARPAYEAYAHIPVYIHHLYPNFFGFNALDRTARNQSSFDLHLPNDEVITAKITQDNGKSLQTNPQSILGKWLLFSIFGLQEYEMLTRNTIDEKEIDSIKITKIDDKNFKVEVCNYLDYERWKLEQKEEIIELKNKGFIKKLPEFRPELFIENVNDE